MTSLSLAHFAIGATGPTVLVALLPGRIRISRTLVLFGGTWALVPDAYKLASSYVGWMVGFYDSPLGNLFWFHRLVDALDPTDSYLVPAVAVSMWIGVTITVELIRRSRSRICRAGWERAADRLVEHDVEP